MCGINLDYQSAYPVDPRVHEFAEHYLSNDFGNPSALHSRGLAAKAALEEAREGCRVQDSDLGRE